MKGLGPAICLSLLAIMLAGCGGDNTTTFVLSGQSPTPTAGASATASSAPSTGGSSPAATAPASAVTPIPSGLRIIIDSPDGSSPVSSPVEVAGTASVANGAVLVVIRDAGGKELGRATTTASAAKPDYGHFDVTVTFAGATPGQKGEIRVMDAATQKNYYFISVRFA